MNLRMIYKDFLIFYILNIMILKAKRHDRFFLSDSLIFQLEHDRILFFLPEFCFTNIHESQDCRVRG